MIMKEPKTDSCKQEVTEITIVLDSTLKNS